MRTLQWAQLLCLVCAISLCSPASAEIRVLLLAFDDTEGLAAVLEETPSIIVTQVA